MLAQGLDIVASDPETPAAVAEFITRNFYVDDGGLSKPTIEELEEVIDGLGPALEKYSFQLKHILRSYGNNDNVGSTNSETIEIILGLLWNFYEDTLKPNFKVYLCKKKRGAHLDTELSDKVLTRTILTMRVVLRAVGCLFDLSGRFLSPVQMRGRSLYSQTSKVTNRWDVDLKTLSEELSCKITEFLQELIRIQKDLQPLPRSWVPKGNDLKTLIYSEDGSIEGYSATLHARSKSRTDGSHTSRIATARCKTSNLDVGDNELQGSLLAVKMAEQS